MFLSLMNLQLMNLMSMNLMSMNLKLMNLMSMNLKLINLKLVVFLYFLVLFGVFWCFLVLFGAFLYLWNLIVKKIKKFKTGLMTSFILLLINTEIYSLNLRIRSECRTARTRKTPNTDNFYTVVILSAKHNLEN